MNCEPEDICFIKNPRTSKNIGKLFKVVRLHNSTTHDLDGYPLSNDRGDQGVRWVVDPPAWTVVRGMVVQKLYTIADSKLRPIRGQDGTDEMLRIAGLPKAAGAEPKVTEFVAGPTVEAGA